MRKSNFRARKITTRVTPISAKQLENLRTTRLNKAKTYAERKYLSSKSFDKKVRADIRSNRFKKNVSTLERIIKSGESKSAQKALLQTFGEKTIVTATGIKRTNTFTSLKQTKRLAKVEKLINQNKFNIKRYVSRTSVYKKNKKFLPKNASTQDILKSIVRTTFYYENKRDILKFNEIAGAKGRVHASNTKVGIKLANLYAEFTNEETDAILGSVLKAEL